MSVNLVGSSDLFVISVKMQLEKVLQFYWICWIWTPPVCCIIAFFLIHSLDKWVKTIPHKKYSYVGNGLIGIMVR